MANLAQRAQAGDADALDELLRILRPTVVRVARLIVGAGSAAAEDAAQEALFDVTRGVRQIRKPQQVQTWAVRVTVRRARRVARRERLCAFLPFRREASALVSEPQTERARAIKAAFDALTPGLRAVAVLRLYAGLSEAETAEALACSLGTVKSQLHEADDLRLQGFAPQTSAAICAGTPLPEARKL